MITATRLETMPGDAAGGLPRGGESGAGPLRELLGPGIASLEGGEAPRAGSLLSRQGREVLVAALRSQPGALGGDPLQGEAIAALADEKTLAVVAGQQPGLFLGPLLTLYKALTAVALARRLSRTLGRRVVPVFWIAAEDDDLSEIGSAQLFGNDGTQRRLRLFAEGAAPGAAVYASLRLRDRLESLAREVEELLAGTPHGAELLLSVARASTETTPVAAFGAMLGDLLGPLGLVVLDPSDSRIKRLLAPVFARERERPLETLRAARAAGERLESLGYRAQVRAEADRTDLFLFDGERRSRLAPDDAGDYPPERLIPGALLRPVCQDYLLPTAALVAGPSETAYLAQTGATYLRHGVPRPVIAPRLSAILVEPVVSRFLERTHADLAALRRGEGSGAPPTALSAPDPALDAATSAAGALDGALGRLAEELVTSAPPLADMVLSSRRRVAAEVARVAERVRREKDRSGEDLRRRAARARERLFPDDRPQERVSSPLPYLARWGNLIPFLTEAYDPADARPLLVRLGDPDGAAPSEDVA